jgi:hypothetical protein
VQDGQDPPVNRRVARLRSRPAIGRRELLRGLAAARPFGRLRVVPSDVEGRSAKADRFESYLRSHLLSGDPCLRKDTNNLQPRRFRTSPHFTAVPGEVIGLRPSQLLQPVLTMDDIRAVSRSPRSGSPCRPWAGSQPKPSLCGPRGPHRLTTRPLRGARRASTSREAPTPVGTACRRAVPALRSAVVRVGP